MVKFAAYDSHCCVATDCLATLMKPYDELTRLGKIRRMRVLAEEAIRSFGLPEAKLRFVRQAGNSLYRVIVPNPEPNLADGDLFVGGHYLLRLHQPGYQDPAAIALELDWLDSMRKNANLPVPEPVQALSRKYLIEITHPAFPETRNCSLLKWVRGRLIKNPGKNHYYAQGQLFAGMHMHSSQYEPKNPEVKRWFDWFGLFQADSGNGIPSTEVWGQFRKPYLEAFTVVSERVKQVIKDLGTDPQIFGLIHGDLGADANGIFHRGQARAIDFDDSGFGYFAYDLSVALEHIWDHKDYKVYRDALVEGYCSVRPLPQKQLDQLDLFLAALNVYISLWAQGSRENYPQYWESDLLPRIERGYSFVTQYLETN